MEAKTLTLAGVQRRDAYEEPMKIPAPSWAAYQQEPVTLEVPSWLTDDSAMTPMRCVSLLDTLADPDGSKSVPPGMWRRGNQGKLDDLWSSEEEERRFEPTKIDKEALKKSLESAAKAGLKVPLVPPGLEPPPSTPSHGSVLHGTGYCKPCAWFWKASGCQNGRDCLHCHVCTEGEIKNRRKNKLTMMRLGLATPKTRTPKNDSQSEPTFGMESVDFLIGNDIVEPPQSQDSSTCSGPSSEDDSIRQEQVDETLPKVTTMNSEEAESGSEEGAKSMPLRSNRRHNTESSEEGGLGTKSMPVRQNKRRNTENLKVTFGAPEIITTEAESRSASKETATAADESATVDLELPSVGAALHASGTCKPCAWFWKPGSCQNGKECHHCHLCPEGEIKKRRKAKVTVLKYGLATPKSANTSEIEASQALTLAASA